jgi:hypothetical protein
VDKADLPRHPFSPLFIDKLEAFALRGFKLFVDVIDFKGDVVQAFAALFQELGHRAIRPHRLKEIDFYALAEVEPGLGDFLAGRGFDMRFDSQQFLKQGHAFFQVIDRDTDMVDFFYHPGCLILISPVPRLGEEMNAK